MGGVANMKVSTNEMDCYHEVRICYKLWIFRYLIFRSRRGFQSSKCSILGSYELIQW
jgi:hypothetical protein